MTEAAPLTRLFEHRSRFLAFVERRVGTRELAEEILQDAFVRGVEAEGAVRDDESIVAWFYRILRNAVIDQKRRQGARLRAVDAFARESEALTTPEPSPDERDAICKCVSRVVDELKPEYGKALRAVDLDGTSVAGWASETGITAGNAAVRLHRARQALAREVLRTCGACAEHGCVDCSCRRV